MEFEGQKIQDGNLRGKVMAALAGAENQKFEQVTALEAFIRNIFKEEVAKKPKLSWRPGENPHGDKVSAGWIGKFNKYLTYIGPVGGYRIQNRMILKANGEEATLEEISDEKHRWVDRHGVQHIAPSDRETVKKAYERHLEAAVASDPLVCSICFETSKDADDRMKHLFQKHPREFAEKVGLPVSLTLEEEPSKTTFVGDADPVAPAPVLVPCEACHKTFKNKTGLSAHKRFGHCTG